MRANTLIIHSQNPSGPKFPNEIVRNSRLTQIFPYLSVRWFSFIFAHRNNNKQSDTQVPKNFPTPRTLAQILTEFHWRWFFPPKNSIVLRSVFLVFGDAVSVCLFSKNLPRILTEKTRRPHTTWPTVEVNVGSFIFVFFLFGFSGFLIC